MTDAPKPLSAHSQDPDLPGMEAFARIERAFIALAPDMQIVQQHGDGDGKLGVVFMALAKWAEQAGCKVPEHYRSNRMNDGE